MTDVNDNKWRRLSMTEFTYLPSESIVRCSECHHVDKKESFEDCYYCHECCDSHNGCPKCKVNMPTMEIADNGK